jgi:hypothetical protein
MILPLVPFYCYPSLPAAFVVELWWAIVEELRRSPAQHEKSAILTARNYSILPWLLPGPAECDSEAVAPRRFHGPMER